MINRILNKFTSKEDFNYLDTPNLEIIEETSNYIFYSIDQQKIKLRKLPSSDYYVFQQVFVSQEYEPPISYFLKNNVELKKVVDAGANIGLTSVYIKCYFPNVKIACIEPDSNNLEILKHNLKPYIKDKTICFYQAGLMGKSGLSLDMSSSFRGGNDWAKQVKINKSESKLKSITINDVQQQNGFEFIDLLKIDIEGAETFFLEEGTDLTFLLKTKVIAIEIHDEYNCREGIHKVLKENSFIIIETGETTLGINKNYI